MRRRSVCQPDVFGIANLMCVPHSIGRCKSKVDNSFFRRYSELAMDTRFLEAFLMAVDNGSIAEAARRLNLTAAGVAKRIRALESEIGAVLISRSGRTIRLTEAGAAIVEHARH